MFKLIRNIGILAREVERKEKVRYEQELEAQKLIALGLKVMRGEYAPLGNPPDCTNSFVKITTKTVTYNKITKVYEADQEIHAGDYVSIRIID